MGFQRIDLSFPGKFIRFCEEMVARRESAYLSRLSLKSV